MGVNAHGVKLYAELGEPPVRGVFTRLDDVVGDVPGLAITMQSNEDTPHNLNVATFTFSPVKRMEEIPITLNYSALNTSHLGLRSHALSHTVFGFKFIGIENDWYLCSGGLTGWREGNPLANGDRSVTATFQPTGPYWVDGTLYS
jgi:hypothetical protein